MEAPARNPPAPIDADGDEGRALPVLDYGHRSYDAQVSRLLKIRIRPEYLTYAVGGATLFVCAAIRQTPLWVAAASTATMSFLWYVYARERSRRSRRAVWLVTDQMLLAIVLTGGGIYATLLRAREMSQYGYWLSYNQTYWLTPGWALEPLRYAAVGIAWFAAVWGIILLRRRFGAAPLVRRGAEPNNPPVEGA